MGMGVSTLDCLCQVFQVGAIYMVMADLGHRRAVAAAHAGRGHDPHLGAQVCRQIRQQFPRAHELARQAIANPNRNFRRRDNRHR